MIYWCFKKKLIVEDPSLYCTTVISKLGLSVINIKQDKRSL